MKKEDHKFRTSLGYTSDLRYVLSKHRALSSNPSPTGNGRGAALDLELDLTPSVTLGNLSYLVEPQFPH
jgi:hypothetical protein